MRKRIASPPTIRLKSESGYTAFGHSDTIQANKSQVIIIRMCTPASPPRHNILAFHTVLLGCGFEAGKYSFGHSTQLWVGDGLMVQQITMY